MEEPLALCADEQQRGPLVVGTIAGICPETELSEVAAQVRLADVVERAEYAALQQREVAFDDVGMEEAGEPHIFRGGMIDARMTRDLVADSYWAS